MSSALRAVGVPFEAARCSCYMAATGLAILSCARPARGAAANVLGVLTCMGVGAARSAHEEPRGVAGTGVAGGAGEHGFSGIGRTAHRARHKKLSGCSRRKGSPARDEFAFAGIACAA